MVSCNPFLKLILLDLVEEKFKYSFEHHRIFVFVACIALFSFNSLLALSGEKMIIFSLLIVLTVVIEVLARNSISNHEIVS